MRLLITVAFLALITSAAYAQKQDPGPLKEAFPEPKVDEEAYRNATNRIRAPEKKTSSDPWGTVRPADGDKEKKKKN